MWGIVAVIAVLLLFFYYFKQLAVTPKGLSQGPFALQSKPEIAPSETTRLLLSSTNTGTLQAFVYPLQAQKTGTVVLCNPSGSSNPGEPNCSTGQYALCKCEGNDCSKCIHSGYVNVINISNVIRVEILTAPDASRQRASAAQLVVRTVGMADQFASSCPIANSQLNIDPQTQSEMGSLKFCCDHPLDRPAGPWAGQCDDMISTPSKMCYVGDVASIQSGSWLAQWIKAYSPCGGGTRTKVQTTFEETIPLPEIPFQKWTMVTVAREGRRFDVYYNGKLVASKRTQYLVDTRSGYGPIVAGDPSLTGKIAMVESFPEKLSEAQILEKYKANADTTGKPNVTEQVNVLDYLPSCKDGSCLQLPALRPESPLLDWQSQYA